MSEEFKTEFVRFQTSILVDFAKDSNINSLDDVPVGNKKSVDILLGTSEQRDEFINNMKLGDDNPAYPDSFTTFIMTDDWAQSFAKAVNENPKPLFIPGHKDTGIGAKQRAIPDGYMVGAKVINGTLYLRNAIPKGESEAQRALFEQTKREIKAGMLATSIGDVMKYKIVREEDSYDAVYYATESVKGQSNSLVESDMPAADAAIIITSFKSGAGVPDSELNDERGEEHMGVENKVTNEVIFTSLKNQLETGTLALKEVASGLGLELITSGQKIALKRLNDAESKVGEISTFVENIMKERAESFKELKKAKLKETFKSDELVELAESLISLKEGTVEELDTEVERVSGLQVFKTIQGNIAASINRQADGVSSVSDTDDGAMEA